MLTRRRFITISAALAPSLALARTPLHVETGIALGAKVTLRLDHPNAPRLARMAMAEIGRLERIFSLYLPGSDLSRLNREGELDAPPFELLECLALAGAVHRASGGRFDPTVQPLWRAEAVARETGRSLTDTERETARALVGWTSVQLAPDRITLRPGTALTLNGIAQGYIADRVAALLAGQGLTRALIDTGEMVALPEGDWPVTLAPQGEVRLRGRALATSSPLGMTFGGDGRTSHILDPRTGRPVQSAWAAVSISAPRAALADALSTAACLTEDRAGLETLCQAFPMVRVEAAVPVV
jgi:thiamine biosynthesis lipoprotein